MRRRSAWNTIVLFGSRVGSGGGYCETNSNGRYDDQLLVEAESYHQWIIEGPDWVAAELPVEQTNLNIHFVNDLAPYHALKVRILNGAHTAMGFLCGLDIYRK